MSVRERVEEAGGFASRAALLRVLPRAEVDRAVRDGEILVVGPGRYATAATDEALRAAHGLNGVLCLTSAALHHGWAVKHVPTEPHVAVPRRRVRAERRRGVRLHYRDLAGEDVSGPTTSVEATLLPCLTQLRFESVLRAIALDLPGLRAVPQRVVVLPGRGVRPDLVDDDLRVVLEADSFAWHGDRAALARDAHRYNLLVAEGWLVLRFSWEQVVLEPEVVRALLVSVVALVERRAGSVLDAGRSAEGRAS